MKFDYGFEELAIVVVGNVQAALINGTATIEFDARERQWDVHSITLDGYENGTLPKPLPLDYKEHKWLWFAICDALEKDPFKRHIERHMDEEIIAAAEEAAERRAEARRDEADWAYEHRRDE